jgi:hypothetical protein
MATEGEAGMGPLVARKAPAIIRIFYDQFMPFDRCLARGPFRDPSQVMPVR